MLRLLKYIVFEIVGLLKDMALDVLSLLKDVGIVIGGTPDEIKDFVWRYPGTVSNLAFSTIGGFVSTCLGAVGLIIFLGLCTSQPSLTFFYLMFVFFCITVDGILRLTALSVDSLWYDAPLLKGTLFEPDPDSIKYPKTLIGVYRHAFGLERKKKIS